MTASMRKPHGHLILTDDLGRTTEADTVQCCHCGAHQEWVAGSGRPHRWCFNCSGVTCSKKECIERCVPAEKELELIEKQWERMNRSWW